MNTYFIVSFVVFLAIWSLGTVNAGEYLSALKIDAKADRTASVKDLGSTYGNSKRKTVIALKKAGVFGAELALAVAIGMQETNTFRPSNYDHSKTGESTNYSAFNFNRDMLTRAGVRVRRIL